MKISCTKIIGVIFFAILPSFLVSSCATDSDCSIETNYKLSNRTFQSPKKVCCRWLNPKQCISEIICSNNLPTKLRTNLLPIRMSWKNISMERNTSHASNSTGVKNTTQIARDGAQEKNKHNGSSFNSPESSPEPMVIVVIMLFVITIPLIIIYEIAQKYNCFRCAVHRLQNCALFRRITVSTTNARNIIIVVDQNGRSIVSHRIFDEPPNYEDVVLPPPSYHDLMTPPPKYEDVVNSVFVQQHSGESNSFKQMDGNSDMVAN